MIDGEALFACNICNEGLEDEHSIKLYNYDKHEDLTLDILNSDEHTDIETNFYPLSTTGVQYLPLTRLRVAKFILV